MFWLQLLVIGSAPLLPSAVLALSAKTRRFVFLPLWVILPSAGCFLGTVLAAPPPQAEEGAGAWVGIAVILISILAMPVVTLAVGMLVACISSTRRHAGRMFGVVLSFVAAALMAFSIARMIPEWSRNEPTAAILWRAPM